MTESQPVSAKAYARAGLLGNPSDGFFGKTVSFAIGEYWAEVHLTPHTTLTIDVPTGVEFESLEHLHREVAERGYYGAERLIKAALKRFFEFCSGRNLLHPSCFKLSFQSNVPRQVGMAGSSAIITAALRALMAWYDVDIAPYLLASLTLSVEQELGIPAGLQDRVIQAYQGLVSMDFTESSMQRKHGLSFGRYEPLPPANLTNVYVAFATNASQPTEVLHNDLRKRFDQGESEVVDAMRGFAELAELGRAAIAEKDMERLSVLVDQNFDLRAQICELHPFHQQMVETARQIGASAKFCGSGGAITGIFRSISQFEELAAAMREIGCHAFRPTIPEPFVATPSR